MPAAPVAGPVITRALLCGGAVAGPLLFARAFHRGGDRRWAVYSAGSGLGMLVAFAGATPGFAQARSLVDRGGLLQRTAVVTGFGWLTALALRTLRTEEDE